MQRPCGIYTYEMCDVAFRGDGSAQSVHVPFLTGWDGTYVQELALGRAVEMLTGKQWDTHAVVHWVKYNLQRSTQYGWAAVEREFAGGGGGRAYTKYRVIPAAKMAGVVDALCAHLQQKRKKAWSVEVVCALKRMVEAVEALDTGASAENAHVVFVSKRKQDGVDGGYCRDPALGAVGVGTRALFPLEMGTYQMCVNQWGMEVVFAVTMEGVLVEYASLQSAFQSVDVRDKIVLGGHTREHSFKNIRGVFAVTVQEALRQVKVSCIVYGFDACDVCDVGACGRKGTRRRRHRATSEY